MYMEFIDRIIARYDATLIQKRNALRNIIRGNTISDNQIKTLMAWNKSLERYKDEIKRDSTTLKLGFYPGKDSNKRKMEDYYPLVNELVYYKQTKFRDAWFVDNVGSFLIVIERKH